jgi:hypothetical protein
MDARVRLFDVVSDKVEVCETKSNPRRWYGIACGNHELAEGENDTGLHFWQ